VGSDLFGCREGTVGGGGSSSVAVVCERRKAFLSPEGWETKPSCGLRGKDCRCTRGFRSRGLVVWLPGLLGFLCDTWVVDDEIGDEFSKGERSTRVLWKRPSILDLFGDPMLNTMTNMYYIIESECPSKAFPLAESPIHAWNTRRSEWFFSPLLCSFFSLKPTNSSYACSHLSSPNTHFLVIHTGVYSWAFS